MKIKKFLVIILAAILLTACGGGTNDDIAISGNPDNNVSDNSSEETEAPAPTRPDIAMSDNLEDFTVSLNGLVYQFPCDVQIFLDDGWAPEAGAVSRGVLTKSRNPDEDMFVTVYYKEDPDNHVDLFFWTGNGESKSLEDSQVSGVGFISSKTEFVLPGGFRFVEGVTTKDDVIAKYGGNGTNYKFSKNSYYQFFESGDTYDFRVCENHE